jgi:integrase
MKTVVEVKSGKESYFRVIEKFNNEKTREYIVSFQSCKVIVGERLKYMLYDTDFSVVSDFYLFLNKNHKNLSPNTKHQYLYTLKYLYSFKDIIEKDLHEFTLRDFYQLGAFLRGFSANGSDFEYILFTKRSIKTVRLFFSVYREYFKFLGLDSSPILKEKMISNISFSRAIVGPILRTTTAPKYIKYYEYNRIMDALYDDTNIKHLRSKCIIRLMYEGGLRIGEVLGLTFEDYELRRTIDDKNEGKSYFIITIRNRLTDKKFQQAKSCLTVTDRRNYLGNDYNTLNVGYQEAITFDFDGISTYDIIEKYERIAHDEAMIKYPKKYKTTIADKVESNKDTGENRYLFLNNHGGVLSDAVWNKEFRELLSSLNISIDIGFRKQGLNHKFRHGFIMILLYELNIPLSKVKGFTRHRNDMSLVAYNNPTSEDLIKLKNEILDEILRQQLEMDDFEI